jgi:hypothetical protein
MVDFLLGRLSVHVRKSIGAIGQDYNAAANRRGKSSRILPNAVLE